jgi:hypothetical protein
MKRLLLLSAPAAMLACAPAMAGTMPCSDRGDVLSQLEEKYRETPHAIGVENHGGLIEVLTAPDGATWTIILSLPNGKSCLLAAGEEWQDVKQKASGKQI